MSMFRCTPVTDPDFLNKEVRGLLSLYLLYKGSPRKRYERDVLKGVYGEFHRKFEREPTFIRDAQFHKLTNDQVQKLLFTVSFVELAIILLYLGYPILRNALIAEGGVEKVNAAFQEHAPDEKLTDARHEIIENWFAAIDA